MSRFVADVGQTGEILHVSSVDPASVKFGRAVDELLGQRIWMAAGNPDRERLRFAFTECTIFGSPQILEVSTSAGQTHERWHIELMRVLPGVALKCIATLLPDVMETPLSSREQRIVWLIGHGFSHDMIANRMDVSSSTVSGDIRGIKAKLGIQTSGAIGAYSVLAGIHEGPEPTAEILPAA